DWPRARWFAGGWHFAWELTGRIVAMDLDQLHEARPFECDGPVHDWGGDGGWGGGSMADACWGGCFSNQDCAEGFICSDIDFGEPCCLEGVSEGLPVGAPCQAEGHAIECASSICIEGPDGPRCSDVCEAAEDCPQGMRRCERIPLSGSDERWCLFE
ncbi:hypothetical protein KKB55_05140, partial [Myxococcota bacterium]|nr:hypothetical protein [Myxococcota bacterium]